MKCAQDEFQRAMFENFGDIKNVLSILHDTIMYRFEEDVSDHDAVLNELLKRAREKNCKFNPVKLRLQTSEIIFFRHIISKDGMNQIPKRSRQSHRWILLKIRNSNFSGVSKLPQ